MSDELISPLGRPRNFSDDKQIAINTTMKECVPCEPEHICRQCNLHWKEPKPPQELADTSPQLTGKNQSSKQLHGYSNHKIFYRILLVLSGVILVLIIVLAVVFRPKAAKGVFRNGSGMVALDRGDRSQKVDVFYQHESGQIRHIVLDDYNQQWSGGMANDTVLGAYASPPRQGTPLMAVSYTIANETTVRDYSLQKLFPNGDQWRIFYIDAYDILQESIASTNTTDFPKEWVPGPLGLSEIKANSSSHTGLSVCQNMRWSHDALGLNMGSLVLLYGGADGKNHMLTHRPQDTAWNYNYTFEDSSAASGIECTCRGDHITDVWMINLQNELTQSSFNFDPQSNSSIYSTGEWTSGVVYNQPVQIPTSISAIKLSANTSYFEPNSTFVHFIGPKGIVEEINVHTYDRTQGPLMTQDSWPVGDVEVVSGSKIASVDVTTGVQDPITRLYGEDSKVFLQLKDNPGQISVESRNFGERPTSFTVQDGEISNIQG